MLRKIPYKTLSHCVGKIRNVSNYLNLLFNDTVRHRDCMGCRRMKEYWAQTLTGENRSSGREICPSATLSNKFDVDSPAIEPRSPLWGAGDWQLEQWHNLL